MIEHLLKKDGYVYRIDLLKASDEELLEISRKMGLALNLHEMKKIVSYFKKEKRLPTDVELQAIAHAWSEHCCYKSSKPLLRKFLYNIGKDKVVAREDAGVVEFDEKYYYVAALESHNHPSAIEPYGGAATGIGGIIRDVLCMGAKPIALIDPLFFGDLNISHDRLPHGIKHPRYLFKRVVEGIRDYGNRVGIPTVAGSVYFHPRYTQNCLVNVGCVGIVEKSKMIRSRVKNAGEVYIYAGGKTGRDGIHGVTFASEELKKESEEESMTAVQLGDPITKEPLIHAVLECNERGLIEGMKDMGGGGLSCAASEMAYAGGLGAEIWLDRVPLREENMQPWEIWISESQERMLLSVKPSNVDAVLKIFDAWDVEAVVIGKIVEGGRIRVYYKGQLVEDVDLAFRVAGIEYEREWKKPVVNERYANFKMPDLQEIFLRMLSSPNVASKEWIIRQYDHEVKGATILKPLHGFPYATHSDAAIIKPLRNSFKGLAITTDVNPYYTSINPYWGTIAAMDEAMRNLASVGARISSFLDCLNFGNPEKPERMGEFYESVKALHDFASSLNIPFISGNVSFYNEWHGIAIPPTPTIMAIGIVNDIRNISTPEFKKDGDAIYLIGETKREMGGSEYYRAMNINGGIVPRSEADELKRGAEAMVKAIEDGIIKASHDISNGGIAVTIAEMVIAGKGAFIDLSNIATLRSDFKLFSESNTRWIVEVEDEKKFAEYFEGIPFYKIGHVEGDGMTIYDNNKKLIDLSKNEIREAWERFSKSL